VPSIRGRDIASLKRSDIGSFEHLLQLLNFINYAFNVHRQQYSELALPRHSALWRDALHCHWLTRCQNSRVHERSAIGDASEYLASGYVLGVSVRRHEGDPNFSLD